MKKVFKLVLIILSLLLLWHGTVILFKLPDFILPLPINVLKKLISQSHLIFTESLITLFETLLGLFLGIIIGISAALIMVVFKPARFWILPLLITSQALPTFAIAPLLVIWFGYGIASKIIMTIIMIFFPITNSLFDSLNKTPTEWLELGKSNNATPWKIFWKIQFPAALPELASGIRIATAIAPIGAIIGEWVGASHGLGYLMLNANARMQIDLMFAVLFVVITFSLLLYYLMNKTLNYFIWWK